jgi:hypothetical protein
MKVKNGKGWDVVPIRQDSIYAGIRWYIEENGKKEIFHLKHIRGIARIA